VNTLTHRALQSLRIDGRTVHRHVLPFGQYMRQLVAYLRKYGWPRKVPLAILARCFVLEDEKDPKGAVVWVFRGEKAARDVDLHAHELGHFRGHKHTVDPHTLRGLRRAIFDPSARTVMHPWGVFRRQDPDALRAQVREVLIQNAAAPLEARS
jgi:hypothetical protein